MGFPKLSKLKNWIGKGKETAEIAKIVIPGSADDAIINQGEVVAEVAEGALTLAQKIKEIFRKKK